MNKFTSSERRGAIVVLAIIACITVYLAISNGIGRKAPESTVTVQAPLNSEVDTTDISDRKRSGKAKKRSSEKKSKHSDKKKSSKPSDTDKSRNPLSEPVTK